MLATLGVWLFSVLRHDEGGQIFGRYFEYGKANWGPNGRLLAEQRLFMAAGGLGLVVAILSLVKIVRTSAGRAALPEILARWAIALLACLAANRYLICIQSECVHFAQFGFFAFMLSIALGNPRLAFIFTVFLGFLDELNQWWFIYWGEISQHLDWSDMCLDACGALAGALPVATFQRIGRYEAGTAHEPVVLGTPERVKVAIGLALLAGFTALVVWGGDLGHFPHERPWEMLDNRKPFHTFSTREGVPALFAMSFIFYYVIDERRRYVPYCALAAALVAWHVAVPLPGRDGEPIHEKVPQEIVPRAKGPITVDGKLDAKEWEGALEIELHTYAPDTARQFTGARAEALRKMAAGTLGPELPTKVRVLWDDKALYVGFECASKDVWARDFPRDEPAIPATPCVEVFLDTDAAERAYYEFEVTPANRVQDLFVYWPVAPQWVPNPTLGQEFVTMKAWDSRHLETAVSVQGELDLLKLDAPFDARTKPASQGYSVEMAIPWADLQGRALGLEGKPQPGAVLRANFYRVEPRRPADPQKPEDTTNMAWSATHIPLDFHRPAFFGKLTLGP